MQTQVILSVFKDFSLWPENTGTTNKCTLKWHVWKMSVKGDP